jgi:hypothetical protein
MWSNDINQGRENAKDVPESDQWDDGFKMPKIPKGWKPQNYHKKQVMSGYNGRGVAREVQDELFLSRQCKGNCPNPHDGHKEGTRWSYHFPANWLGQTAVNKAVALRRINCSPRNYDFNFGFTMLREDEEIMRTWTFFTITSKMDIYEAISIIVFKVNEEIASIINEAGDINWLRLVAGYDHDTGDVWFGFRPLGEAAIAQFEVDIHVDTNDSFYHLMNCKDVGGAHWNRTEESIFLAFHNVWNRQDLYFHGSFVNHTAFNYLGKAGDFYPEPNKLYKADNITQEFFLEVSLDGMTPVDLPYENFDVELTLIVDTESAISF